MCATRKMCFCLPLPRWVVVENTNTRHHCHGLKTAPFKNDSISKFLSITIQSDSSQNGKNATCCRRWGKKIIEAKLFRTHNFNRQQVKRCTPINIIIFLKIIVVLCAYPYFDGNIVEMWHEILHFYWRGFNPFSVLVREWNMRFCMKITVKINPS